LACLALKIRVEEFAIGFGKALKQWKGKTGTLYSLRAIPLGGFVEPAGQAYSRETEVKDQGEFAAKPWWKRSIMVAAGAGMNYVLAFVIFFFVVLMMGLPVSDPKAIPPRVGEVIAGYPAAQAGLTKGDLILSVNQTPVADWQQLIEAITAAADAPQGANVQYQRGEEVFSAQMPVTADKKLGVALEPVYQKTGVFNALKVAAHQCYYWTALSLKTITEKLIARQAPDVAGPIGIFEIVGKGVHSGAADYFFLIGLISVAIGMFNLFPIPILDGGHIVFFIIEGIRGKRAKEKTLYRASSVGLALILMLVVYATYSDIARLTKRNAAPPAAEQTAAQAGK
ncbi:MAG: M50 family metallopeptidase, partial [Elusimicrobiota bacterium]|nr:M50 family metallopeptidase [Elusimicrobiota bacterium]